MNPTRIVNGRIAAVWTGLVVLFVVVPLAVIIPVSLSAAQYISFPWNEGFSFRWYAAISDDPIFLTAALHTAILAALAAVGAVVVGTAAALAVVRYSFPGKRLVTLVGSSSLFVPQVLTGLALSLALSAAGVGTGLLLLLVGHIVITIPFVLRISTSALTGFNVSQEWAAQNLGAGKLKSFFLVTLPQVRSGIFAGAIMAAIMSIDNIALSIFLTGPGYAILPVYLYQYASNQFNGIAAAVCVCMVAFSLIAVVVLDRMIGLDKLFGGRN